MYIAVTLLIVLGFVSHKIQVCGDFINPLHYIRYERAATQPGECLVFIVLWANKSACEIFYIIDEGITIEVTPHLLNEAGEWVNVTWHNPKPQDTDWIGAYLARGSDTIDPVKHTPFKFQVCHYKLYN